MKKYRIGIVCYPSFGGSGVIATELGRTLADWGHEIHIFSYAAPSRLDSANPNLRIHEVSGFSYPLFKYPPYDLALASRLIEVAESNGLDLVHSHYAIPHAISAFLARESLGICKGDGQPNVKPFKTVTTLHGTDITLVGAERSYFPITRFGIEKSDSVTSVSEQLKRETQQTFGPCRDIQVIPNFVDTKLFAPIPREGARKEKILIHVSNFRPVKRVCDIVLAFSQISRALPSRLLLVGDGPDLRKAMDCAKQEKLESKVDFLGNQTAVGELLAKADLYLLASETESFGLSALEAMSCGVPVVAPAVGGLPEVVAEGETGFLVEGDIPKKLAEASIKILQDESMWKRFSIASRDRAVTHFERESVVRRYLQLYESVLS